MALAEERIKISEPFSKCFICSCDDLLMEQNYSTRCNGNMILIHVSILFVHPQIIVFSDNRTRQLLIYGMFSAQLTYQFSLDIRKTVSLHYTFRYIIYSGKCTNLCFPTFFCLSIQVSELVKTESQSHCILHRLKTSSFNGRYLCGCTSVKRV